MIQIEEATIVEVALHRVSSEIIAKQQNPIFDLDEQYLPMLKKLFLKPFVPQVKTYEFTHDIKLEYNVLFQLSKDILADEDFNGKATEIAKHLGAISKHPNIKDGDVYIVKYDDVKFNNTYHEALGIYKFEDKERFIETTYKNQKIDVAFKKGISSKKPDKAVMVIFTEEPYTLLMIDNNRTDTDYWQNDFIKQKSKDDFVNNTNNFLSITKNYITKQINEDFEVSKTDQIDLLNRSIDYFKTHEAFDKNEFEQEVFADESIIESFRNFDHQQSQETELDYQDNFKIAEQAVKKQARSYKSILKLDKNFHVYIHGNRELIERGIEPDGRKYYKIYFDEER